MSPTSRALHGARLVFEQRRISALLEKRRNNPGRNLIQLDFCFTYTGEERRMDEAPVDKVAERSDQWHLFSDDLIGDEGGACVSRALKGNN